jgi:hypothetical protein
MPIMQTLTICLVGISVYLLPALVAWGNEKRNWPAIAALNLLLGWTVLGWVVALVWGLCKDSKPNAIR